MRFNDREQCRRHASRYDKCELERCRDDARFCAARLKRDVEGEAMPDEIVVRRLIKSAAATVALVMAATADEAHAAGFQLLDQSASGEGEAFAGAAAIAEDASTIFYNPAGMSFLNGYQAAGGIQFITTDVRFKPTQATTGIGG